MSDGSHDAPMRRALLAGSLAAVALATPAATTQGKQSKGPKAAVIITVTGLIANHDGTFEVNYSGIARDLRPGSSGDRPFTGNAMFDFASADRMRADIIGLIQFMTAKTQFTDLSPNQVSVLII